MVWHSDRYIRMLLDTRERWGVFLSLTAIAGLLAFLADRQRPHWVNFGPLLVGAFGSLYVFVVNCYYHQAEAIGEAKSARSKCWCKFAPEIGALGWLHIVTPFILGVLATVLLYWVEPGSLATRNGSRALPSRNSVPEELFAGCENSLWRLRRTSKTPREGS